MLNQRRQWKKSFRLEETSRLIHVFALLFHISLSSKPSSKSEQALCFHSTIVSMAVFLILLIINHMLLIIHPNKDLTQANHGLIESNTETSFQKRGYYLIYSYIISYPPSMIWLNEVNVFKGTVFKLKKSTERLCLTHIHYSKS